jgi:2-hydroxy-3-oxopropionate reductase
MTTIAFIGLGIMGAPMAGHLVRAGHSVVGYNRSRGPVDKLIASGGQGASSVAEAVRDADVIITIVPDSPDVQDVALNEDGIYANAKQGAIHIDMSSIRPDVSVQLAEAGKKAGIRVVDAPVSGGEAGAKEAKLSIMVGAEQADFDEVKPILEAMGSTIVLVGPPGSARTAWTLKRPSRCWQAGLPAVRYWTARGPACWQASSNPASELTSTTKTWASSWTRRGPRK